MTICSWNCNGKFREKYEEILEIDADIYVIQECENPKKYLNSKYAEHFSNYLWIGNNDSKGLGVFAKNHISLSLNNNYQSFCLRHFLPVRVNNQFDILAVWACRPYIEEYYIYQSINKANYEADTIIIGDFNSNAIWDKKNGTRTHTAVVQELSEINLVSAYHLVSGEKHGYETQSTFFLYRHTDKGYHIDYAFANPIKIKSFEIISNKNWLNYSDHMPIVLETY